MTKPTTLARREAALRGWENRRKREIERREWMERYRAANPDRDESYHQARANMAMEEAARIAQRAKNIEWRRAMMLRDPCRLKYWGE